ncbi:helix-turn-helix domain-containing protein [Streptomyces sp. NPDC055085]
METGREYFAEWFSRTLRARGISGKQAAEALGVPGSYVSRWRNGKARPDSVAISKIAAWLGVDPMRLLATAGRVSVSRAGIEPYPLPPDDERRNLGRAEIEKAKHINPAEKEALLTAYDQLDGRLALAAGG